MVDTKSEIKELAAELKQSYESYIKQMDNWEVLATDVLLRIILVKLQCNKNYTERFNKFKDLMIKILNKKVATNGFENSSVKAVLDHLQDKCGEKGINCETRVPFLEENQP